MTAVEQLMYEIKSMHRNGSRKSVQSFERLRYHWELASLSKLTKIT